jgi:hypothetical protein
MKTQISLQNKKLKSMTPIAVFLILILPGISYAQHDEAFDMSFFNRLPGARVEAMGRGYVSVEGDMAGVFFNPASIATLNGLVLNGSFSSPYYLLENARYIYFSAGYGINKYLSVGLSRNHFNFGEDALLTDETGTLLDTTAIKPFYTIYSLTLASQPSKNLYIGFNINYYHVELHPAFRISSPVYFDFGAIKKFNLRQYRDYTHTVSVGASIVNLNAAKVKFGSDDTIKPAYEELPVITRYGANYTFAINQYLLFDTLKIVEALFQMDYMMLLNSEFRSGIHTGAEILIYELLAIRAGYYQEKIDDLGIPESNEDKLSAFTYGFGVQIPLHKITRIPLHIKFDYTSLPQESYSKIHTNWDNFRTYTFSLNWVMRS